LLVPLTDPGDPLPTGGSGLQSSLGVKEPDPGLPRRVVSRESIRETMTKWCWICESLVRHRMRHPWLLWPD